MIAQTFSRGASIRELDETENTCSDAKGGSREELDILCVGVGVLESNQPLSLVFGVMVRTNGCYLPVNTTGSPLYTQDYRMEGEKY